MGSISGGSGSYGSVTGGSGSKGGVYEVDDVTSTLLGALQVFAYLYPDDSEVSRAALVVLPNNQINMIGRKADPPKRRRKRRRFRRLKYRIDNMSGIQYRVYSILPQFREGNYFSGNL